MKREDKTLTETELQELKTRFLEIYKNSVKREGADRLLEWLEKSDFFVAPASTRFHNNFAGGLLQHSLNVYDALVKELRAENLISKYTVDTVALVALMHDACKINFYGVEYRNAKDEETGKWYRRPVYVVDEKFPCGDHADKSVILLQNYVRLSPEEILAIRSHMGGWDNAIRGGGYFLDRAFGMSKLAVLLHIADQKATYLMEAD